MQSSSESYVYYFSPLSDPDIDIYVLGMSYQGLKYEKGNCGVSIMRSGKLFINTLSRYLHIVA